MEVFIALAHDRALRRVRRFRDRLDPLNLSDEELIRYYRFPRVDLIALIGELEPYLQRRTRRVHAIPTHTQVLVALRIFASGSFQHVIGDICGLSQASVSRIMTNVVAALADKARQQVVMPSSPVELRKTAQQFYRIQNFPRVIGAIDCTHIPIKAPYEDEELYINRKRFHSLNVQVVCNAAGLITSYCARFPGSTNDSFIWRNSSLWQRFADGEFGDYVLLGDSGYPLEAFLMTPLHNPATPAEERYNRAHTRTRVIVEQTFGILKSRFRCLHRSGGALQYTPLKCAKTVVSCILLHNRCVQRRIPLPPQAEGDEVEGLPAVDRGLNRAAGRAVQQEIIAGWFV